VSDSLFEEVPGREVLSIAAFYDQVTAALDVAFPAHGDLWVRGEVQKCTESRGHAYIDLIDPDETGARTPSVLNVKCWQRTWAPLKRELADSGLVLAPGMTVSIRGQVDLYKARGSLSLVLQELDVTALLGRLAKERQELLDALAAEGLLDAQRRLDLPVVPLRIGLVASPGTEGCNDFLGQLLSSGFGFQVTVARALVQGDRAPAEVAGAVAALDTMDLDVICVVRGGGSKAMLADGLFTRFPKPEVCLAFHDSADAPAGQITYTSGYSSANADSVDITVRGIGGHGAHPQKTKDPVLLAAQIVVALQTIVSRETRPGEAVVVTVGTIHGGTKNNIIPDEVKLQLTVRTFGDESRTQTLNAIKRIVNGCAVTAGVPADLMPVIKFGADYTPSLYNDPALTERLVSLFGAEFGATNVVAKEAGTGAEDFSRYGRTADKIPICMFNVGAVNPAVYAAAKKDGTALPSLHSSKWAPDAEPAIKTGITALTLAALDLLAH